MSPLALNPTTEVIKVVCSLSLEEMPQDVKALEEQIIGKVHECGREFYALCLGAFQQRWLQQRRTDYTAVRWRRIDQLTAFGLVRIPVRVVRERGVAQGGYFTLSKALLQPKATRLLSPWVEKRALEAGTGLNYRPAAAELCRWLRVKHWKRSLLSLTVFFIKSVKRFVTAITPFLSIRSRAKMSFSKLLTPLLTKTAIRLAAGSGGRSLKRLSIARLYISRQQSRRYARLICFSFSSAFF